MKTVLFCNAKLNHNYKIKSVNVEAKIKSHLQSLGIEKGECIKLLKYNYFKTSVLIKVLGINYVIDNNLTRGIELYE